MKICIRNFLSRTSRPFVVVFPNYFKAKLLSPCRRCSKLWIDSDSNRKECQTYSSPGRKQSGHWGDRTPREQKKRRESIKHNYVLGRRGSDKKSIVMCSCNCRLRISCTDGTSSSLGVFHVLERQRNRTPPLLGYPKVRGHQSELKADTTERSPTAIESYAQD
ncbi:uncharacterized protein EI90DRAFT_3091273 [Cantharellus anzutake]|uniref:uncharacterized protein n=1 Tax=Cantharellus anzutake TaxID=1750568 RepID=UPI00190765E6|nr:uncharacterized protein EI90DRAFT_3091273 [Cantharellus anzutake]KAF8313926.1 hypothetical protein EI90DRAFT_3091273 [Cantharellus anzutake]